MAACIVWRGLFMARITAMHGPSGMQRAWYTYTGMVTAYAFDDDPQYDESADAGQAGPFAGWPADGGSGDLGLACLDGWPHIGPSGEHAASAGGWGSASGGSGWGASGSTGSSGGWGASASGTSHNAGGWGAAADVDDLHNGQPLDVRPGHATRPDGRGHQRRHAPGRDPSTCPGAKVRVESALGRCAPAAAVEGPSISNVA